MMKKISIQHVYLHIFRFNIWVPKGGSIQSNIEENLATKFCS